MIGNNGLTASVLQEIENSLNAHELIKIKVFGDDREARVAMLEEICEKRALLKCITSANNWWFIAKPKLQKSLFLNKSYLRAAQA